MMHSIIECVGNIWPVIVSAIAAIAYIVRIEAMARRLRIDFDMCKKSRDIRITVANDKHERLQKSIDDTCILIQKKLDQIIHETGVLTGKVSLIERTVNGGDREQV